MEFFVGVDAENLRERDLKPNFDVLTLTKRVYNFLQTKCPGAKLAEGIILVVGDMGKNFFGNGLDPLICLSRIS